MDLQLCLKIAHTPHPKKSPVVKWWMYQIARGKVDQVIFKHLFFYCRFTEVIPRLPIPAPWNIPEQPVREVTANTELSWSMETTCSGVSCDFLLLCALLFVFKMRFSSAKWLLLSLQVKEVISKCQVCKLSLRFESNWVLSFMNLLTECYQTFFRLIHVLYCVCAAALRAEFGLQVELS